MDVLAAATRVARVTGGGTLTRAATVCGARTYRVRITELVGKGSFRLTVSEP